MEKLAILMLVFTIGFYCVVLYYIIRLVMFVMDNGLVAIWEGPGGG